MGTRSNYFYEKDSSYDKMEIEWTESAKFSIKILVHDVIKFLVKDWPFDTNALITKLDLINVLFLFRNDMPDDAAVLCRRLSLISFTGGSTPENQRFPISRGSNYEGRQYRPLSTPTFATHLLPPSSSDFKNSFQRLEYLAIPKKFSAKLSPSLGSNDSMNSEVIILSQPQKILTYRIHIPRGDERSTVSSEPVFSKSKRKLLFAREARAKSAPPVCSWNKYLQNSITSGSHTCKYDKNKCQNYPCNIPMEYNSLGFDIDHNRENRFKTANQLSTRARQRLIKHLENEFRPQATQIICGTNYKQRESFENVYLANEN